MTITGITFILLLCLSNGWLTTSFIAERTKDGYHYEVHSLKDANQAYRNDYAQQMLSYMNFAAQPCDDFYEFACGNWENTIQVRQTERKRFNLGEIAHKLVDIAEKILDMSDINNVAPEYSREFHLARKYYRECLDADLITMSPSTEYLKIIQQIGGFPAIDPQWNPLEFNWLNMCAHMSNYDLESLVNEGVDTMYPFTPFYALPSLGFEIELRYDSITDTNSNAYQTNENIMHQILSTYSVPEDQIAKIIYDIFDYLKEVLAVFQEFDEDTLKCEALGTEDPVYTETVDKLWLSYFQIAWMGKFDTVEPENKPCSYLYYKLHYISEQRPQVVANYLSLKFLYHMDAHLKGDAGLQKEYCIKRIQDAMTFLIDHIYMKLYVDQETLDEVRHTIVDVRKTLRSTIEQADWLDESTREAALLKESLLQIYVGRYEDSATISRLIAEMQNLKFIESNYGANNLNLKKFQTYMARYNGLHHEELDNSTKPLQLLIGMQANAFNYIIDNAVYVMAGVLQPPVFHKSWPNALRYGTLGFLVGHELTHGFDTEGSKYDHEGKKIPWWSDESKNQFNERAQCFIDHFDGYYVPQIKRNINGNFTRDENIADAGGVSLGFAAYHRLVEEIKTSSDFDISDGVEQLPGIPLTPDQLFFLGTAQIWCAAYTEANYWQEIVDVHTIDRYRVLGMNANNADFAKAYNCPVGSKLNPRDKCKIW